MTRAAVSRGSGQQDGDDAGQEDAVKGAGTADRGNRHAHVADIRQA